jgi:hypothetical protein
MARSEYQELSAFLGGYLHEDWLQDHGSPDDAIDEAISGATPTRLRITHQQLVSVSQQAEDDVDLRRILNDCFSVKVLFPKPKHAREFASTLQLKLLSALEENG